MNPPPPPKRPIQQEQTHITQLQFAWLFVVRWIVGQQDVLLQRWRRHDLYFQVAGVKPVTIFHRMDPYGFL